MEATTERPKRNGVMRRSRLANPSCLPRSLRTSASRTAWHLFAMMVDCWRCIRLSLHESKGFRGLDGSCQKSREFQEVRSSRPVVDSLSPYLCCLDTNSDGKWNFYLKSGSRIPISTNLTRKRKPFVRL